MPSQLVKCAFGFRSFNDPKTKCVPLFVELGSEQGGTCPRCPVCHGPCIGPWPYTKSFIALTQHGISMHISTFDNEYKIKMQCNNTAMYIISLHYYIHYQTVEDTILSLSFPCSRSLSSTHAMPH